MLTFPSPFPSPPINPGGRQNAVRTVQFIQFKIQSNIKTKTARKDGWEKKKKENA